jgi:hypothetical protein
MKRAEALAILQQHKQEFAEKFGVTRLGVFGSVARDQATEKSDVDVVMEMTKPDLFFMVGIKDLLEAAMHCPVDIILYDEYMGAFLKKRIDEQAVYV